MAVLAAVLVEEGLRLPAAALVPTRYRYPFPLSSIGPGGSFVPGGHKGTDFWQPQGANITAIASGEVTGKGSPGSNPYGYNYGYWVRLKHSDGKSSFYAHMHSSALVADGDDVEIGEHIGEVGSSGVSGGNHLHLGLMTTATGVWMDPVPYIKKNLTVTEGGKMAVLIGVSGQDPWLVEEFSARQVPSGQLNAYEKAYGDTIIFTTLSNVELVVAAANANGDAFISRLAAAVVPAPVP